MTLAVFFPGMGTQAERMGWEAYETEPAFRRQFDRLNESVAVDLEELCFGLSAAELSRPANAEPAIAAVSYCYGTLMESKGYTPDYVTGASLGQFTALAFAGAIDPPAMVELVRRRGELIRTHERDDGVMTVVIPTELEPIEARLESFETVAIGVRADENTCVLSGTESEVNALIAEVEAETEFCETIPLETITSAFHSPLLEPVRAPFREALREYTFSDSVRYPIVSDATGDVRTDTTGLATELTESLVEPVRMDATLETLADVGVDQYIQVPPGKRWSETITAKQPNATVLEPFDSAGE